MLPEQCRTCLESPHARLYCPLSLCIPGQGHQHQPQCALNAQTFYIGLILHGDSGETRAAMVLNRHSGTLVLRQGCLTPGVTSGRDQASCGVWVLYFLSHLCFQERRKCRGMQGCNSLCWEAKPYLVQPLRKGVARRGDEES